MNGKRIVIGVGNVDRGDDGAGRATAKLLARMRLPGVEIMELDGEATTLVAAFEGAAEAFLVDACSSGAPPGTTHRFDAAAAPLPVTTFGGTTHGFGLSAALELARALGVLPSICVVYAIEGEAYECGARLSQPVENATRDVARLLAADLGKL